MKKKKSDPKLWELEKGTIVTVGENKHIMEFLGADGKGHMVFNRFQRERDGKNIPKIHPTQKPVNVIKKLIEIFTDPGDVVIDPCCGSGSTLRACVELGRTGYGFEIKKDFYNRAKNEMLTGIIQNPPLF